MLHSLALLDLFLDENTINEQLPEALRARDPVFVCWQEVKRLQAKKDNDKEDRLLMLDCWVGAGCRAHFYVPCFRLP